MGGSKSTAETSKPPSASIADEDETLYTPQPSSSGASLLEAGNLKVSGSEFPKITLRKPLSSEDTLPRMRLQEMNLSSESEDTDSDDGTFAPLASGFDVTKTGLYMALQQNKELRQKNATLDLTKLTQRTQASDTLPVLPRRHTHGLKPASPVTRSSSILNTPSASPKCQEKNRAEHQFGKVVKECFREDLEACSSSSSSSGATDFFDSVTRIWITINYYLRRWYRRVIRELLQIHERMMQEDLPWRSRGRNRRQEPPY